MIVVQIIALVLAGLIGMVMGVIMTLVAAAAAMHRKADWTHERHNDGTESAEKHRRSIDYGNA